MSPPASAAGPDHPARLLLVAPTSSYRIGAFLAAALRERVAVTVATDGRPVLEARSAGGSLTVDLRSVSRAVAAIRAHAERYPLAGVVGTDDETALLAAAAAADLGLTHARPGAVAALRDKHRFRRALAAAGVLVPRFALVPPGDDGAGAGARVGFPCVAKPLDLSAGRGVVRADDPAGLVRAVARSRAAGGAGRSRAPVLVEGFVAGPEVAVEGILSGGRLTVLAVFDKPDAGDGPHFEETLLVTPSRLPAPARRAVESAAGAALAAVGLGEGPVHAELRLGPDGPVPLEIAPRTIGGHCGSAIRLAGGGALEDLVVRHALGRELGAPRREARAAGTMMIPIPTRGVLAGVDGEERARAVAGIESVRVTAPRGRPVAPPPEGDRYLGFIVARGEGPAAVESALREAHRRLAVRIAPDEP